MGSSSLMVENQSAVNNGVGSEDQVNPGMKEKRTQGKSRSNVSDSSIKVTAKPKKKRMSESTENVSGSRKMPKRSAACRDFKHKSVRVTEKPKIETKRDHVVEDELEAICLTASQDAQRPNRRLTDFVFHDEDGIPQPVEMLEVTDIFITGLILPLEEMHEKDKAKGVRCEGFGRIETWAISGYEDGSPVVWVSTEIADYDCVKPANSCKNMYCLFYEKAHACIDIYQKLSRSCGGDPNQSFEELLAKVVRSMSGRNNFPRGMSVRDFIVSHGEFIFYQLIGLDETSNKNEQMFSELPVLAALRDGSKKNKGCVVGELIPSDSVLDTNLEIRDRHTLNKSHASSNADEEDVNMKYARLLQEQENWQPLRQNKRRRVGSSPKNYYIKINEDEIANDYPLPAYYKNSVQETDEYLIFDGFNDANNPNELPQRMLHNWPLYNSDSRLISLDLLPMKPCANIDTTI